MVSMYSPFTGIQSAVGGSSVVQHKPVIPLRQISLVVSPIMSVATSISSGSHCGEQGVVAST